MTYICRVHGPLTPEQYRVSVRRDRGRDRWYCKACNRDRAVVWYYRHQEKAQTASIQRRRALRREVLAAYGDACACCGETTPDFLTMDHVNGDGGVHRRAVGASPTDTGAIYRWLKRRNFPRDGFQLLCFNCHCAKTYWGACPHARQEAVS